MKKLIYVHDPMCSWCWAFQPVWSQLLSRLPETITPLRLLGGLAPDTDNPMPEEMQTYVQDNWHRIQQAVPGTRFNFDFWSRCQPRRATYPACRAVIAARQQDPAAEEPMILAIQKAYYLQARNPSENATLVELAIETGLNSAVFARSLQTPELHEVLLREIADCRRLRVNSFPTLLLQTGQSCLRLTLDYHSEESVLQQIGSACN